MTSKQPPEPVKPAIDPQRLADASGKAPSEPVKRRLGRGLDGLLPPSPTAPLVASGKPVDVAPPRELPVEALRPGTTQPRTHFGEEALAELTRSIASLGVLEPILVRPLGKSGNGHAPTYAIVAGERRWRAAQRAGLKSVPVFVRDLDDKIALEAALVENLQREDLNPIEMARALRKLVDEHGHTQETIAERLGKDRSTIANSLRLLKLPEDVLTLVEEGRLSEGHGRALLAAGAPDAMRKLARGAVDKGWSVREVERRARSSEPKATPPEEPIVKTVNTLDLERRLGHALGARVSIEDKKGRGQIVIAYTSFDELDRLVEAMLSR